MKCPIRGKCVTKSVVYKATVTYKGKHMSYIASTARKLQADITNTCSASGTKK